MATPRTIEATRLAAEQVYQKEKYGEQALQAIKAALLRLATVKDIDACMKEIGYYPDANGEYTKNLPPLAGYIWS